MQQKFTFYKTLFILNIISLVVLLLVFFIVIDKPYPCPPTLEVGIILTVCYLLYFLNDLCGLSLVNRAGGSAEISLAVINGVSVLLFIQFIAQLFLAYW